MKRLTELTLTVALLTITPNLFAEALCPLDQANFGKTRQQVRDCQGKNCPGVNTPHDCGPLGVEITPNPVAGVPGKPIRIRLDSTQMCNGQSVKGFKGQSSGRPVAPVILRTATASSSTPILPEVATRSRLRWRATATIPPAPATVSRRVRYRYGLNPARRILHERADCPTKG